MGNVNAPPPKDKVIEKICKRIKMTDDELNTMFQIFCKADVEGSGYVAKQRLFEVILNIDRNLLGDALCELCEIKDSQEYINFTDFVMLISTYATFEPIDMLQFTFAIFDREKKGFIDKDEYKHFLATLWEYKLTTNLKHALDYLEDQDTGDGQFIFSEIKMCYEKYPALFYPIFKLQVHTQRYTLGEAYWETKKLDITNAIEVKRQAEKAKRKKKIKEGESDAPPPEMDDSAVMKRMGILYYLMPWKRGQERRTVAKIAAVDAALEAEQNAKK